MPMRVFRVEIEVGSRPYQPYIPHEPIRKGYYGAWVASVSCPGLLYMVSPKSDTPEMDQKFTSEHFCALPSFEKLDFVLRQAAEEVNRWGFGHTWPDNAFIVEYEIEPDAVSNDQVIFRREYARFISQIPANELIQEYIQ